MIQDSELAELGFMTTDGNDQVSKTVGEILEVESSKSKSSHIQIAEEDNILNNNEQLQEEVDVTNSTEDKEPPAEKKEAKRQTTSEDCSSSNKAQLQNTRRWAYYT